MDIAETDNIGLVYAYRGKREEVNQLELDAYSLIDLRYAKTFLGDKLVAALWLTNLLDKDYTELNGFSTKGRNFRLGITYQF